VSDSELHEHQFAQADATGAEFSNTHDGTQGVCRGHTRGAGLWIRRPFSHAGQQILPKAPQTYETDGAPARGEKNNPYFIS